MSKWFFINSVVLVFALWKITTGSLGLHILFGGLGLLLILYNWTRHAVFSTIRSNISRQQKIKYAQLSKKVLPFHKWTGSTALFFILIHGGLITNWFGLHVTNIKMLSGLIAAITLASVVIAGWFRFFKTTYRKRIIHLTLAFCLFGFVLLHLIF